MKKIALIILLSLLIVTSFTPFSPLNAQEEILSQQTETAPVNIISAQFSTIELYFSSIKQGRVGLIGILGDVKDVKGVFLDAPIEFFSIENREGKFALLTAPISQAPRNYDLVIKIITSDGTETITLPIAIESGGFLLQDVIVVGEANNLLNREIEDAELMRIFELAKPITFIAYWQGKGFIPPIDTELTSPFGAVRVFNGLYETLHTGWDYNAPTGKPLKATSAGKVVFAGNTAIRGNYILIDHGYGIYSGYAHLSVMYVTQGQILSAGQFVGVVGTTGRSSSAHAHFEMLINNQWIDTAEFLTMYIPR